MSIATLAPAPSVASEHRTGQVADLSHREQEVLALMAIGRSNGGVACDLLISEGAVEKHVASIFLKLGLLPSPDVHRRVLAVLAYLDGSSRGRR